MAVNVEQVGKYLGKTIEDAMGRSLGKLVGLTTDVKDEVKAIQIARNDGEVVEHPIDFVKMTNEHVILLQAWRVEAEELKRENDIVRKRRRALDLLLNDGDINQPEYNALRTSYEDFTKGMQAKRDTLLDNLQEVEKRLDQQITDLEGALTNDKMLYSTTEIDEQTYKTVTESILSYLEIDRKERKDIANTREYLIGIDSPDNSKAVLPPLSLQIRPTPMPEPKPETETIPSTQSPTNTKSNSSDVVVIKMNELAQA
jgi:hypothetical protein